MAVFSLMVLIVFHFNIVVHRSAVADGVWL